MPETGGASVVPKKGLTLDDLIAAIDRHERNPSNIPKVDTFHFCGEKVSEWLERVEQALVGRPDVVKFQPILQYILHSYHQEVKIVIDVAQGSWERFKEGMQRKYRLGDGLLTTTDLEAMNNEDFTTIGAFVQEFKKRARKVHGISKEAQSAIFLGLLTASEAVELTRHRGGSTKLTWATIDRGVEVGCLDQVEQRQVRLQRQKRKERDATASGTPGVTRIVTDVLAQLRYATEPVVQRRVVTAVKVKGKKPVIEEAGQEELWEEEEPVPQHLTKVQRKESLDQLGSLNSAGNVDEIPESQDDEFEEGKIKEAFRAEEYDGIYLELGLLLSCEMRLRDASDTAQRMLQRYLVRDGHLFVRREVGNPRRVVCGRNRQIDVVATLHDGIAGGHRGIQATYTKISELYYWDGMMDMVGKFYRSCVPCQERSRLRQGESLHPRLEREVGAVVHLDLLFMPLGDQGYNYIFDARDNLSGFVDGRAIRTKTGLVLVSCIEEYYLRYPFVREFVMDKGSEFTFQEVQELLAVYGVATNYTTAAHPQANAPVERGHSTITNLLAKWTEGRPNQWPRYLRAAFFVENFTVKRSTKYAPATLWYGRHATFPIERFFKTWRRRDLEVNLSFEELLDIRARQVGAIEERIEEASDQVARSRMDDKARWDQSARVRKVPLAIGDVVLLYNTSLEKQWSRKLDKRWSDFTKTAMPRGGKGTRPSKRPLGASGGYERHGHRQRESTSVYNDGDIELFLDSFWEHARRMGWTFTQAIGRLRGAGRFEEPIARIRREATTRQEV
ncbi:hypothetical protein CBR_g35027 [Chara braunii]|uniref:Integrase catalytic domain-containing protein n=1 Tax=Chara braunii TaxID=69332 RepID=A0A388LK71_CHABU|nr:hypothetical protein CBR_g35027 [Chara braunii]|eukprot:GBG82661.1 hypothetical protein CBR_g35027 [Chara braunii]